MLRIRVRKHIILTLTIALVLMISSASGAFALSKSVKCEVYKATPANVTVKVGKSVKLRKVQKFTFTMNGFKTFNSLESVLGGLSGTNYETASFKWITGNKKIATVNSSGKITGVKKGETYIYPVQKGITVYKKSKRGIIYLDSNLLGGIRVKGGFAAKVKVNN